MKTVFKNGRIFSGLSLDHYSNSQACILVNDDTIEYVGPENDQHIIGAMDSGAQVHDLHGRTIAPGFIDGHMHLLMFGNSLEKVSLEECKNLEDIRKTISSAAKSISAPRILCRGWMHSMTDGKALASMLDDLDSRPIYIDSKDLHSTWCNTAALEEMGVQSMADPAGGEILRDAEGEASGLLSEAAAVTIVWPHLAKVATMDQKLSALRKAFQAYNARGYTGIVEMAMEENSWEALGILRQHEDLTLRVAAHWLIVPSKTSEQNLAQVDRAISLFKEFNIENSPNFRITGIKVICDGVVDGCTAALLEPYSSNGASPDPLWDADALKEVVEKADAAGLQCALHAIGDAAVKLAIDTLQSVGSKGKRHRIEHLELTSPGDSQRLREAGITASIQPVHADPAILRAWPDLIGHKRCSRAFAYREFLDDEVHIALGTDAPTAPAEPMPNLYNATTRRSAREPQTTETVNPHFALPLLSAFSAATAGSAYSCFADRITGTIEAGKQADFVVLDMQWAPERLLEAKIAETWFAGRKVF